MGNPEEYRRTRRIVHMLLRVASQPRCWTRRRLAAEYEISEKQVDKDVYLLRHGLRMPLSHCPEGYYFERHATLPILSLSLPEALSLLLAARLGQQMPGVSHADLAGAIARIESLLPPRLLPLASALSGGREKTRGEDALGELQLAIAERARLRIRYRSASKGGVVGSREVDPYTLLPYLRAWYLVGYCHERKEVRTFKLERVDGIARTGERFEFPGDFDLAGYMGETWGLLRGEAGEPEEVVLEFEPETSRWVRDQEWHRSQRVEELPDGRVRLSFHVGITPELRRWVFGFGRAVRVVRPASLGEWVMEEAGAVVGEGLKAGQAAAREGS